MSGTHTAAVVSILSLDRTTSTGYLSGGNDADYAEMHQSSLNTPK